MDSISSLNSSVPHQDPPKVSSAIKGKEKDISSHPPSPVRTTDRTPVRLSPETLALEKFQNQLNNLPDIRQERVRELQQAIENGDYAVSSKDLANKLIQEL